MTHKVDIHTVLDGEPLAKTLRLILQHQARIAASTTALTDNSAGTAGTLAAASTALANVADDSTSLAQKAGTETALGTVLNALATLFAKANTAATVLGLETVTNNSGGSSGSNTVAAVTKTVTAAATGVQATEMNAVHTSINRAFYVLAAHVNRLAVATGHTPLAFGTLSNTATYLSTLPAITATGGTAADPGVTKADVDAALTVFANNTATIAEKINEVIGGAGNLQAVAV